MKIQRRYCKYIYKSLYHSLKIKNLKYIYLNQKYITKNPTKTSYEEVFDDTSKSYQNETSIKKITACSKSLLQEDMYNYEFTASQRDSEKKLDNTFVNIINWKTLFKYL